MDNVIGILTGLIGTIIGVLVPLVLAEDKKVRLPYVWIIVIVLTVVITVILLYEQKKAKKQVENLNTQINELKSRLTNAETFSIGKGNHEEGTQYLLMALCQSYKEPLRIAYLKKAKEAGNLVAALILANDYKTGIEDSNGKWLVEQNREECFKIYKDMLEIDKSGVCAWELGWMYQWGLAGTEKKDREKAWKYYLMAAGTDDPEKTIPEGAPMFVKAFNSMGIFLWEGHGPKSVDKEAAKRLFYYAAVKGDIYAKVNYGIALIQAYNLEKNVSSLKQAEENLLEAAQYDNSQAFLQLGILNEIYAENTENIIEKRNFYKNAAEDYLTTIRLVDNQFAAAAYFKLGNLVQKHKDDLDCNRIMTDLNTVEDDFFIDCYMRSFDLFRKVINRGYSVDVNYDPYYKELKERFSTF